MSDEELAAVLRWRGSALQEGAFPAAAARIEQLTAERDRLRKALEYILAECTLSDNTTPSVGAIKYAASAALKGESHE